MLLEVARYTLVGGTTNILNFGLFVLFRAYTSASVFWASLGAYALAITYSFFVTNYFVFEQNSTRIDSEKLGSYLAVISVSAILQASSAAVLHYLTEFEIASWIAAAVIAAVFNYFALKRYVFISRQ